VNVTNAAQALGIKGFSAAESAGKLAIKGTAEYQLQKDLVWDVIKKQPGWEQEVAADIKVEKTDIYGIWEVKAGDSLSKIAKSAYDDAGQYMRIFEANKNILKDPNVIHPGQKLTIPNK
jgi:nucleoid-associated protein YgaU